MQVNSRCHYQWAIADEVIQAAAVVTAPLLHLLSILHCSGKVHNEFFSYTFNAIWVLPSAHSSLLVLSSSRCATQAEGITVGWLPLSFHRGKKLVAFGLLVLAVVWLWDAPLLPPSQPSMPPRHNPNISSHYCLPWGMPLLLWIT